MSELLRKKSPMAEATRNPPDRHGGDHRPGVNVIWTRRRSRPALIPPEQSKLGTSLSKSLSLSEQYSLTLQNGYNLIQQASSGAPASSTPVTNYENRAIGAAEYCHTGTSFSAARRSPPPMTDGCAKIGAEQKLFAASAYPARSARPHRANMRQWLDLPRELSSAATSAATSSLNPA